MQIINIEGMKKEALKAAKLAAQSNSHVEYAKHELNSHKDPRYTAMCEAQIALTKVIKSLRNI